MKSFEYAPLQDQQDIPEAERADMGNSPVTQEEMDAAMEALHGTEAPLVEADIQDSPVTEVEMRGAVEAIDLKEPDPVGDSFEKPKSEEGEILLAQDEESASKEASTKLSDAEKIEAARNELMAATIEIPPDVPPIRGGPEGDFGAGEWNRVEYKKCERCKGTGRWFLFIRCPVCLGQKQIAKTLIFADGGKMNLSNR